MTTSGSDSDWRRNQVAVTLAAFIGFTGFTLVMPFLPLYFEQLGVHDLGDIAIWSGISLGVTPAITAAMAPVWARVADRHGRKLMVAGAFVACAFGGFAVGVVWATPPRDFVATNSVGPVLLHEIATKAETDDWGVKLKTLGFAA
jgi:MFS family permease